MTENDEWEDVDVDVEGAAIGDPSVPTVTVTLTVFEVRVLQIILQHLIAGQSIDPSTLDYDAMLDLGRQLNLEPPPPA
jgi:hypothetical protein